MPQPFLCVEAEGRERESVEGTSCLPGPWFLVGLALMDSRERRHTECIQPQGSSCTREHDDGALGTPPLGEPLSSTPQSPAEHVGPGRGEQGGEFAAQAQADSEIEAGAPSAAGNALVSVDAALREAVTERLVEQLDIDPEDLQVEVDDGVVALIGDVDDPAVPERAERIAAAVSGVQSVTNRIRVRRGADED